ncbi:MAG: ABC transporter ATP-binding protein [Planctomycetes bacterium]|jgi:ABC-2 type transport system ATP-binding protein|nr:ABC transporter ATP-binding protein [Planctomycetota bacterium]
MIRVSELTKRFDKLAVDRISFEVARGEVVGFLGPNGAGKTTTIRVLTGYHPATSGKAWIAGHDVEQASLQARQQIGYLPENVPIYPELRVVEFLRYRAALKGVPAKQRRLAVDRAMQKADIQDVARKLVGNVSRGYRQRVGLADALVANPPILILDEPTSGLDPNQRRRIKQVVRDLAAEHTILFSSHILGEVQDVSSRILVIHRGTLRADGPPDELVLRAVGRSVHVTARCTPGQLDEVVRGTPGLRSEAAEPAKQDGYATCQGTAEPGADPTQALGDRLLAAGIAVRELRVSVPTLEEYFTLMTEGSDRHEEAALAAVAAPEVHS